MKAETKMVFFSLLSERQRFSWCHIRIYDESIKVSDFLSSTKNKPFGKKRKIL